MAYFLVPTENTKCYLSANKPDVAHVEVERLPLAPRALKAGEYLQYHCDTETQKVWASVEKIIAQPTTEEQILTLTKQLEATDYKVVKCYEYQLANLELPYDIETLHADRQALRDKINELKESEE